MGAAPGSRANPAAGTRRNASEVARLVEQVLAAVAAVERVVDDAGRDRAGDAGHGRELPVASDDEDENPGERP